MSDFRKKLDAWVARFHFAPEPFAACQDWADVQRVKDGIVSEIKKAHAENFVRALRRMSL